MTTTEQVLATDQAREASARYVVMSGKSPYWSVLGTYQSGHMQMDVVRDGFDMGLSLSGFATVEEARQARDEWVRRNPEEARPIGGGINLAIVALPIRINPSTSTLHPAGYYDPRLSVVK